MYKIIIKENNKEWDKIVDVKPEGSFKYLTQKEKYDYSIKKSFLSGECYLPNTYLKNRDESDFGFYISRYNRIYDRYLTDKIDWESILDDNIKKYYTKGKGNEIKSGKFNSVASSSRFAVSSFSKKNDVSKLELIKTLDINGTIEDVEITLEEDLCISGIDNDLTSPQLDVKIKTSTNHTYFVEVKCHEIFDSHKTIKLKSKYKDLEVFKRLNLLNKNIDLVTESKKSSKFKYIGVNNKFLTAKDFGCSLSTFHFDIKQFICHLMGVLSYQKTHQNEKIHFYYLFYNNERYLEIGNKNIYNDLKKEMSEIFCKFTKELNGIELGYCFNNKFNTLNRLENNWDISE